MAIFENKSYDKRFSALCLSSDSTGVNTPQGVPLPLDQFKKEALEVFKEVVRNAYREHALKSFQWEQSKSSPEEVTESGRQILKFYAVADGKQVVFSVNKTDFEGFERGELNIVEFWVWRKPDGTASTKLFKAPSGELSSRDTKVLPVG